MGKVVKDTHYSLFLLPPLLFLFSWELQCKTLSLLLEIKSHVFLARRTGVEQEKVSETFTREKGKNFEEGKYGF